MKKLISLKSIIKWTFLILILFFIYNLISIYTFSSKDETQESDVAIVLGAGIWKDKPSPIFKERINHSIWLYKNGYVKKIIFTGGKAEGKQYSEAEVAKEYAIQQNMNENDIYIEEKSTITDENLKYAKPIMDSFNYKTALIVSDPLHMKRAMILTKDNHIEGFSSPTKTTKIVSTKEKLKFIFRENLFYSLYLIYRNF
ncbi:YdcF family protein [Empedobacter falsenii]|uniref:YdcF family protein n=1 Tax=Empedobacter falsenii TaxID=343874 RepID=UPI002577B70E|nr:YdcF family protein [Empedobacter falsenii]MDM1297707.1 YdcF family protein [Empedobacter falsenii]MDM1317663.1 YdcF family protein [Empedobacter falsenii]